MGEVKISIFEFLQGRLVELKFINSHLTYCTNVHPATTLEDVVRNLETFTLSVKEQVCPNRRFGVGLWLPASVLDPLLQDVGRFKDKLDQLSLYVFTINAFPFSVFHQSKVKKKVYYPDWSDPRRLEYTCRNIEVLKALLPESIEGSISTVPITYGKSLPPAAADRLLAAIDYCRRSFHESGKKIRLAIEPEPDCYLESTDEIIAFFERLRTLDPTIDEFLGVCFDTCHMCIQGENLAASIQKLIENGVPIAKVQISTALTYSNKNNGSAPTALERFNEPVYLHQTRVFDHPMGTLLYKFSDLDEALCSNPKGHWLIHYHVPLYFTGTGDLSSTQKFLTKDVLGQCFKVCPHIEIETYTHELLASDRNDIANSITKEFHWLRRKIGK